MTRITCAECGGQEQHAHVFQPGSRWNGILRTNGAVVLHDGVVQILNAGSRRYGPRIVLRRIAVEPEGEFKDWASIVMDATKLGLEQAASESDVMAIFRNNKNIYDRLKAEPGSSAYDALMEEFKTARNKFKEQA